MEVLKKGDLTPWSIDIICGSEDHDALKPCGAVLLVMLDDFYRNNEDEELVVICPDCATINSFDRLSNSLEHKWYSIWESVPSENNEDALFELYKRTRDNVVSRTRKHKEL